MLVGHELLIIALNGDSVLAEGITHYPATILNHHRKQLASHTMRSVEIAMRRYICFFCLHLKFIGASVPLDKEAAALPLPQRARINTLTDSGE